MRPPHLRDRRRRLPRGGDQPRGGVAGRPPRARAGWSTSTTTTTSPSTDPPSWPTPTTSPSASPPTAGTSTTSARWPTTSTPSRPRSLRAMAVEDQPSLIILRSHIGWPSPHLTDTAKAHGDPFPRGGDPPDQGDPRPPARRDLLGARRGARPLPALHPPRPAAMRATGAARFDAWDGDKARWEAAPGAATACPGGRRSCPTLRARRRADGHPQGHQGLPRRHRRRHPRPHAGQRRPHRQHRDGHGRRRSPSRPRTPAAARSTTGSASTAWARS